MKDIEKNTAANPELLPDGKLEDVSGGTYPFFKYDERAKAEGRPVRLACKEKGLIIQDVKCPRCPKCNDKSDYLYCRHMTYMSDIDAYECVDTKCYKCDYLFGTCDLKAGTWEVYIQNWGR